MEIGPNGQLEGDRLRRLKEQHNRYSQQLEYLLNKPYLSEDEKLEEIRLKKLKLHIKDQMTGLGRPSAGAINVA